MNLLKKLTASVASLTVAFAVAATPVAAAVPEFTDISGHWAEEFIIDLAENDIISTHNDDGTPKTMYFPNNSLTRAELTKLAIEAFYGETVSDLADAFADGANPTFSDVSADDWFFDYVEVAKGLDIVNGFPDGTFGPNSPITRSAALKVLLLTGDIETMLMPEPPFTDVAESDWFYEYVATAYNQCIVNGTTATTFSPNGNITRGEVAKVLLNSMKVADGEDICTDTEDPVDGEDPEDPEDPGDEDDPEDPPAPVGSLEVSVSSETPEGSSIPRNGSNVPFLALDLTNNGDQDIEVTGVTVSHGGLGNEDEIQDVKVFDGIKQRGTDRPFTNDEEIAPLNLASDPVTVPADATKTIIIAGDINASASGGEHNFSIASSEDITAVGAETGGDVEIVGDFPASGETMTIANVEVGSLEFTYNNVSDNTIEVGETDVELAKIEVEAGSAEDVLLQAMTFEFNGPDDGDIGNMYIEYQGQRVSDIVELVEDEKATFDLTDTDDEGWILEDGDNRTFRIKGDILAGVNENLVVEFDEVTSDVLAQGLTFGFGVGLSETNDPLGNAGPPATGSFIGINGGDITFAIDSSSRDVAPDTDNVEFGVLTITNMGEAVELKEGLTLIGLDDVDDEDADDDDANTDISDIRLVNIETGATFMGPEDLNDKDNIVFNDETILETGETITLSIQGDVENTATEGEEYAFAIDMDTVEVEGVESNKTTKGPGGTNHDIRPSGDPSTKQYTVAKPTVTLTTKSLGDDDYVADAENVVVFEATVRANSVEDIYIRDLTFENDGAATATNSDVDDYSIYKKEGNVLTPVETGKTPTATAGVTFSSLDEDGGTSGLLVPAGDEFTIVVTANIASNPTSGRTIDLSLTAADAEDEDGDDATVSGVPVDSAIFTIQDNGSITVTVDNNKTDTELVPAGLTDIPVGVFKFEAVNESVEVEDLAVKVNEIVTGAAGFYANGITNPDAANDSDAIDAVSLYYYDDGTAVKKTSGQAASVSSVDGNDIALFQDLDLIVEDSEDLLVEVRVDLAEMDDSGSSATAESGHAFNVELILAETGETTIRGVDSGADVIPTGQGSTLINDVANYSDGAAVAMTVDSSAAFAVNDYIVIARGTPRQQVTQVTAIPDGTTITATLANTVGAAAAGDDVEDNDNVQILATNASDSIYVFNNKVIAEESANQPTAVLITGTRQEMLKFDVDFTGDTSDEPYIHRVDVTLEGSNACVDGDTTFDCDPVVGTAGIVYLYNGDNELIAATEATALDQTDFTLVVGTNDSALPLSPDVVADATTLLAGNQPGEPISVNGETYTIRADIATNTAGNTDDAITTKISINGSTPATGQDDIFWIDGGSTGADGAVVQWIDLGSASSINEIEHTRKSN